MKNSEYNSLTKYEKAMHFFRDRLQLWLFKKDFERKFVELCEAFQALSRPEQDIFLMAQLKAMNGGKIIAS